MAIHCVQALFLNLHNFTTAISPDFPYVMKVFGLLNYGGRQGFFDVTFLYALFYVVERRLVTEYFFYKNLT
jgi:hypothetical protein